MSKSSLLQLLPLVPNTIRRYHGTGKGRVDSILKEGLKVQAPLRRSTEYFTARYPKSKAVYTTTLPTDAGGVWVTTEPTAFPVYGTTIGGKHGNSAARADALSTIKIEVPLPELAKMKAVQDPYGKNILRKGNDPRAVEKFPTWAGLDVPTTVLLNDVKPQWLKNIGYVEERNPGYGVNNPKVQLLDFGLEMLPRIEYGHLRDLSKADRHAFSLLTGHDASRAPKVDLEKSPARYVKEYIEKNRPIRDRAPKFPRPEHLEYAARKQGVKSGPKYIQDGMVEVPAPNEVNRYSFDFIPAYKWTEDYRDYVKPGEPVSKHRKFEFAPGAISRGIGGVNMPPIKNRKFDWNTFNENIANGELPWVASLDARPSYRLDWDNIIYSPSQGYHPNVLPPPNMSQGHITAAPDWGHVGTGYDEPWTLYDVYKIRHDPKLTAADRMKYRDALIRHIYDDGVTTGVIDDISPNATWREIMQAMMKIQTHE